MKGLIRSEDSSLLKCYKHVRLWILIEFKEDSCPGCGWNILKNESACDATIHLLTVYFIFSNGGLWLLCPETVAQWNACAIQGPNVNGDIPYLPQKALTSWEEFCLDFQRSHKRTPAYTAKCTPLLFASITRRYPMLWGLVLYASKKIYVSKL